MEVKYTAEILPFTSKKSRKFTLLLVNHAASQTKKPRVHTYNSFLTLQAKKKTRCVIVGVKFTKLGLIYSYLPEMRINSGTLMMNILYRYYLNVNRT